MPVAEKEYKSIIKRLKIMITDSEYSLRGFCDKTQKYGFHEQIYHSNMSEILRITGRYNLSLQQFLMILKLLNTTPAEFFAGSKESSTIAEAFDMMDATDRKSITRATVKKLEGYFGTKTIVQRLMRFPRG